MIEALLDVLEVNAARVDYLSPILSLDQAIVGIATLNYDMSVERAASRAGIDLDTGVEGWTGGYEWSWREDAQVKLLKLHGSLNWYLDNSALPGDVLRGDRVIVWSKGDDLSKKPYWSRLGVVFGNGVKLRSDGPFLAMLHELDRLLRASDRLVIVGYSLRDEHINAAIRRWVNHTEDPKIVIIDPFQPEPRSHGDMSFYEELLASMYQRGKKAHILSPYNNLLPGNLRIKAPAARGLKEVFGPGPGLTPAAASPPVAPAKPSDLNGVRGGHRH